MDPLHDDLPTPAPVLPMPVGVRVIDLGRQPGPAPVGSWAAAVIQRALDVARVLTSDDGACPACAAARCACYEAGIEGFRVWCAFCDHFTECYPDLDWVRREWQGSREAPI